MDIALFPIPGSVTFPGVPCPLHVFEPRYRNMVRHCVDQELYMGVCHTIKVLHESDRDQTLQEAMNSNQSTYKPCEVFSAGPVRLLEELEDGRLMILVETNVRLVLGEEKQTLPFNIWSCEELHDEAPKPGDDQAMALCKEKILTRLLAITHGDDEIQAHLRDDYWQGLSAEDFSFAIAGRLGMDAELAQQLLQSTHTRGRLETILALLNRGL